MFGTLAFIAYQSTHQFLFSRRSWKNCIVQHNPLQNYRPKSSTWSIKSCNFINIPVIPIVMTDPLYDDVRKLLDKGKGDERILKQILRACEHDEMISNYERNYVYKLAGKYLGQKFTAAPRQDQTSSLPGSKPAHTSDANPTFNRQIQVSKQTTKNTKIFVGIGIAAVIIIATALSLGMSSDVPPDVSPINPSPVEISLKTDLLSYQKGDILSISGRSPASELVNLSITSPTNQIIWSEQVVTKNDGIYSTLTITGGENWSRSGIYVVTANNMSETTSSEFSFTG